MSLFRKVYLEDHHANGQDYPEAGGNAQPEVKQAVGRFRQLPMAEREDKPLLYWLLGSGTPDYKMSKEDSEYQLSRGEQKCSNCEFAYKKVVRDRYICSQISGPIKPGDWCRLWRAGN